MKIVLAHKYFYPRAGAEVHVFDLKVLLEQHGHTVIPFAMHHPQNIASPYEKYFVSYADFENPKGTLHSARLFCRMMYSWEARKKFEQLVRDEKPDIVHIHNLYHHLSPSILDVCRAYAIPAIQTVHDYHLICANYKLFSGGRVEQEKGAKHVFADIARKSVKGSFVGSCVCALEVAAHRRLYNRSVSCWIAPSLCVKNKLVQHGIDKERIVVLGHFFDYAKISPTPAPYRAPFLLCVGRLAPEKGFDVAVRAIQYLKDIQLVIIGDGGERAHLELLAKELGVSHRVQFLGVLERHAVFALMKSAFALLVPSVWLEPFCYVALEALACGTPVIASRIGGIPEILTGVCDDLLFDPGDPKALLEKIMVLSQGSFLWGKIADAARSRIEHTHNHHRY